MRNTRLPPCGRFLVALNTLVWMITDSASTKNEIVLLIVGGLFVVEALSVIIQTGVFKATKRVNEQGKVVGKRVFAMAPIHHHYELKGWDEPKIIVRFWLISALLALLALGTLKLR